jgi:preprotein translocase subunit YajC
VRRFLVGNGFFIVLLAMFAFLYFLLIRPQRQQQRKHAQMLGALKAGDEIITTGGIYGEVVQLDDERVMVEIDDDVRVAVARRAIATVVPPEELQRLESEEAADEAQPEAAKDGEPVTAEEPMTAEEREAARS